MAKVRKPLGIRVLKGLGWFFGSIVGLLVVIQIVLVSGAATSLVNKFAADYVDGELAFGKVSANVFSRFPSVSLSLEDATLTYPHERFDSIECAHSDVRLLSRGRGEQMDTLASFRELTVAVNPFPLLRGNVHVSKLVLDHPRAFAKYYNDSTANWNIFKFGSEEKEESDSSSFEIKGVKVRKVALKGNPRIVFCDLKDSLNASLRLKEMTLSGSVSMDDLLASNVRFNMDSLFVAGRFKADTLFFGLDNLSVRDKNRKAAIDLDAHAYARTRAFGRFQVPISLSARAEFPEDSVLSVSVSRMHANLAGIPFDAHGDARIHSDRYFVDAEATIDGFDLNNALRDYVVNVWDGAKDIETNAKLTLTALAQGYYSAELGLMPDLAAQLIIPNSYISHKGLGLKGNIDVDIEAEAEADQPANAKVNRLHADVPGLIANAVATASDLLGADPVFFLDLDLCAQLDSLSAFIPKDLGYWAEGDLDACLSGRIRKSQMSVERFSRANLTGALISEGIYASSLKDTLEATLGPLEIELAAKGNKIDDSVEKGARMLALSIDVDTLSANYKTMALSGKTFHVMAQNSADILDSRKKADFYPFCGEVSAKKLFLRDVDSTMVGIVNTKNSFRISPKSGSPAVPVLRLNSSNERIFMRSAANRVGVKDLSLNATAVMNTMERKIRFNAMRDSLARIYPDVPRDSLFRYAMRKRAAAVPDWMQDEEFRKSDINISLSEDMAKYYREWDLSGNLTLGKAMLSTPYFPLKNTLENVNGYFTNDRLDLNSFTVKSGQSDISAKGSLWGLRRAILGHGIINLDMDISSDVLNANELLGAYDAGRKVSASQLDALSEMEDDAFEKACQTAVPIDSTANVLLVVPGNVNAKINLEANRIVYSSLDIDWMESEIAMKERCLQVTNTVATSNMGDIYFEGFYSTRTKQNIKTGFWINLVDITAEKVIDLVPQMDTILPLLKSFSGLLDCTMAATTSLDEQMNILMPNVNGVVRITGKDLLIDEDETISKLAKVLMFRNKKKVRVDKMSVEGLLQDSKLEVFPFMLNVDRYKVALSGIQNMDMSFKYHMSVIKSPLWFKFGINVFGDDFDDWKWKLGKAKYRNAKKVPVFTKVIDQSTKSLTASIHTIFEKGVDAAVAENENQQAIADFKASTSYVQVVDEPLDTLSGKDARELEKMEKMTEAVEALGFDLDEMTTASYDALDDETKAKLKEAGLTRQWLEKRESEEESADDSSEENE